MSGTWAKVKPLAFISHAESSEGQFGIQIDALALWVNAQMDVMEGWIGSNPYSIEEWFEDCLEEGGDGLLRENIEERKQNSRYFINFLSIFTVLTITTSYTPV